MLTVAEAATLACRRPATIHDWVRRGLLPIADRDRRGRLLVEWDAVLRVERDTRARDTTGRTAEAVDRA